MKIGFVIPTMHRGGAERAMASICNALVDRGYDIHLMLTEDAENKKNELDARIKVHDVTNELSPYIIKIPRYIHDIRKILRDNQIDIVVSFIVRSNIQAIIACRLEKIPIIVSERNDPYSIPSRFFARMIRNICYVMSTGFVFQTIYAKEYFSNSIQKKSVIILNPVTQEIENVPSNISKRDVIITASRLAPQKNIEMLIEAFSLINDSFPSYNVEIYGAGEQKYYQDLIDKLGLANRVKLMGLADNVITKIAESKIFVLSSNFEGLSNALIEAMCVGTACVATDAPAYGNRDLITNGCNGFLIPVGDKKALAERLYHMLNDEEMANRIAEKGKELYSRVRSDIVVDQWEEFIKEIHKKYHK